MANLENTIIGHLHERGAFAPEKIELGYNSGSFAKLKKAYKAFERIEQAYRECFSEYLDEIFMEPDKFTYFNCSIEDLKNIFEERDEGEFYELFIPDGIYKELSYIDEILYQHNDTVACLRSLFEDKETENTGIKAEYIDSAIRQELKNADEKIKEIYQLTSKAYENAQNTDNIIQQYHNAISEYGKTEFKENVLNYLKEEYGYDDLADSLRGIDSFGKISNRLKNATIDDLPISDAYYEVKEKIDYGNATEEDMKMFNKIEIESEEMKNELKQFAQYFEPEIGHYDSIQNACKDFLGKIEKNYIEGIR